MGKAGKLGRIKSSTAKVSDYQKVHRRKQGQFQSQDRVCCSFLGLIDKGDINTSQIGKEYLRRVDK